jgi:hypothetical protein
MRRFSRRLSGQCPPRFPFRGTVLSPSRLVETSESPPEKVPRARPSLGREDGTCSRQNLKSARGFRNESGVADGITAVFGSAGPLKPVDRCSGEQLTRRATHGEGRLAIPGRLSPPVFRSARQSSPLPVSSKQANRHKLMRARAYAAPTTAARQGRRSQTASRAETSPVGTWLTGLPP